MPSGFPVTCRSWVDGPRGMADMRAARDTCTWQSLSADSATVTAEISRNVGALALSKRHRRLAAAIAERRSALTVSRYSVTAGRNGGLVDTDACRLLPTPEDPLLPGVDIGDCQHVL
jgi:hypothetical protein